MLIVDDERIVRETNRRFTGLAGTQKQLRMEFQEAKNGKEAVYLHLAGASYDLILMKNHMPVMTGIQVYNFYHLQLMNVFQNPICSFLIKLE